MKVILNILCLLVLYFFIHSYLFMCLQSELQALVLLYLKEPINGSKLF